MKPSFPVPHACEVCGGEVWGRRRYCGRACQRKNAPFKPSKLVFGPESGAAAHVPLRLLPGFER